MTSESSSSCDRSSASTAPSHSVDVSSHPPSWTSASSSGTLSLKRRHRELDARRRRREAAVLSRLEALAQDLDGESDELRPDGSARKKEKLDILERAAEQLQRSTHEVQQLRHLLAQLSAAHLTALLTAERGQQAAAPTRTGPSPALPSSPSIPSSSSTASLSSPSPPRFTLSSLEGVPRLPNGCAMGAIDVETGTWLDANTRFSSMSGWSLADIVGYTAMPPHHCMVTYTELDPLPHFCPHERPRPFVRGKPPPERCTVDPSLEWSGDCGEEEEEERSLGPWVRQPRVPQFPATRQIMREVIHGTRPTGHFSWRCALADGHTYEMEGVAWVTEPTHLMESVNEEGEEEELSFTPGRSRQLLFLLTSDSPIRVD